jgi:phosphoribosylaminoimidazole-succinocarboxamide synthase
VVLPTPIPDKGKLLTSLSLWWFEQLADVMPNHVISATDVPAEFEGRAAVQQVDCSSTLPSAHCTAPWDLTAEPGRVPVTASSRTTSSA